MTYESIHDLPKSVQDSLPKKALEIYKEAFNSAWERYKDPESRNNKNDSREEVAHKVAWSAVKEKYEKKDDAWVRKE